MFEVRRASGPVLGVAIFAVAMAYVEAAAVLYLRTIYGGIDPVGPRRPPILPVPEFIGVEIGREAATLVMLASVGFLAARTPKARLGAFAIAFGVWDIFYYVFLWLFAGWPASPLSPDVLFLIPLPWWGPVIAPVLIASLIVVAGAATIARELGDGMPNPKRIDMVLVLGGASVCLLAFMADALLALPRGVLSAFAVRAGDFPWMLFSLGLAMATIGLVRTVTNRSNS